MGVNVRQLMGEIIIPVLQYIEHDSLAARNLILGTIIHESACGEFVRQYPQGPALGICQMETATHDDIWRNYLAYHLPDRMKMSERWPTAPHDAMMIFDMGYAVAMCRYHYARVPAPLPDAHDINAIAQYWKTYYNTANGKGTVEKFLADWNRHTAGAILC